MPSLSEIKEFAHFIIEAYGAVSSLFIFFIGYLIWQLRCEQQESREIRTEMAEVMQQNVEVQVEFVKALAEIRTLLQQALATAHKGNRDV